MAFSIDDLPVTALSGLEQQQPKTSSPKSDGIEGLLRSKADEYGIDQDLFVGLAKRESSLNPNAKNGASSAGGLFQFLDGTWKQYGRGDKFDPEANADAAARMLSDNLSRFDNDYGHALAAHHVGPGKAREALTNPKIGDAFVSTQKWLSDIYKHAGRDAPSAKKNNEYQADSVVDMSNSAVRDLQTQRQAESDASPMETSFKRGWNQMTDSVANSIDVASGNMEGVNKRLESSREYDALHPEPSSNKQWMDDWKSSNTTGWLTNPAGFLGANAEQLANSAPSMVGSIPGSLAGAAVGTSIVPGVGTVIGGLLGGFFGSAPGSTAVEMGSRIPEMMARDGVDASNSASAYQWLVDNRQKILQEGTIKGLTVAGFDGLSQAVGIGLLSRPAMKMAQANAKTLATLGVNTTDKAAVQAAMNSVAYKTAMAPAAAELKAASTFAQKAMRGTLAFGAESAGEFGGEYSGELFATGKGNFDDALLEAVMAGGQSAITTVAEMAGKGIIGNKAGKAYSSYLEELANFTPTPKNAPLTGAANLIQLSAENAARVQQASLIQQSQLAEEENQPYEPSDVIQQQHAQQAELQTLINEEKKNQAQKIKDTWMDQHIARATQGPAAGFADMVEYEKFLKSELDHLAQTRAEAVVTNDAAKANEAQQKEVELQRIAKDIEVGQQKDTAQKRDAVLKDALANVQPGQNPLRAFDRALKAAGFKDTTFTEQEKEKIARWAAFNSIPQEEFDRYANEPAAPNELIVPERKEPVKQEAGKSFAHIDAAIARKFKFNGKALTNPKTGKTRLLKADELAYYKDRIANPQAPIEQVQQDAPVAQEPAPQAEPVSVPVQSQVAEEPANVEPVQAVPSAAEELVLANQPTEEAPLPSDPVWTQVEKKTKKPLSQWTAEEIQARLDRGGLEPESKAQLEALLAPLVADKKAQEEKTEAHKAALQKARESRALFKIIPDRRHPDETSSVTVKNGIALIDGLPALDEVTGKEIAIPEGAGARDVADILIAAGAITKDSASDVKRKKSLDEIKTKYKAEAAKTADAPKKAEAAPDPVKEAPKTEEKESIDSLSDFERGKAMMGEGIAELMSKLGGKSNLTPEEESAIIPIMSKIFRGAALMGYIKFKESAQFVMKQIRSVAGDEIADKLSIDNIQAGYINIAKEIGGDKKEALAFDSIDELMAEDDLDTADSVSRLIKDAEGRPVGDVSDARRKEISDLNRKSIEHAIASGVSEEDVFVAIYSPGLAYKNIDEVMADSLPAKIEAAEAATDTNPTEAQKNAGNYSKGKVAWNGLTISIETPKGAERTGKDASGKEWSVTMPASYGYFLKTVGADEEHLDVFIGPNPDSGNVFVINQDKVNSDVFDEHKILVGFDTQEEAKAAYFASFTNGFAPRVFGSITEALTIDEFKAALPELEKAQEFNGKPDSEKSIPELQKELESAKFGKRMELNTLLIDLVTKDAEEAINRGEMPVYKTGEDNFIALHPSAQKDGMIQATRYSNRGVFGDSQYNDVREAIRDNALWFKPRMSDADATKAMSDSLAAEAEYQKSKQPAAKQGTQETRELAIKEAQRQSIEVAEDAKWRKEMADKEAAEKAEEDARKEKNRGLSIGERKANADLDKPTKLPREAGVGGAVSRRVAMENAVAQEREIVLVEQIDYAAKRKDEEQLQRAKQYDGYIPGYSNRNHPKFAKGYEASQRLLANQYKKPEYRLYAGRNNEGGFFEITKTEYDYAQKLKAAPAQETYSAPQQNAVEKESVQDSVQDKPAPLATFEEGKTALRIIGDPAFIKDRLDAIGIKSVPRKDGVNVTDKKRWADARSVIPVAIETRTIDGVPARLADVTIETMENGNVRLVSPAETGNYASSDEAVKYYRESYKDSPEAIEQPAEEVEIPTALEDKPVHIEDGEVELATPAVIEKSLKKSVAMTSGQLKEAQKWLEGEIDKAMLNALDGMSTEYKGDMGKMPFSVFDVPGDGTFKIPQFKGNLSRFKDRIKTGVFVVGRTPKEQKVSPADRVSGSGTESTISDFLDDGDYLTALEFAKQINKPIIFGWSHPTKQIQPIAYVEARPFKMPGFEDFNFVSAKANFEKSRAWSIIDLSSGLAVRAGYSSRKDVEAAGVQALRPNTDNPEKTITAEKIHKLISDAFAENKAGTQEQLEAKWVEWAEKQEESADANKDARKEAAKPELQRDNEALDKEIKARQEREAAAVNAENPAKTSDYPFQTSDGKYWSADGKEELESDWVGVFRSGSGKFFYLGQENNERAFYPLEANTYDEAVKEAEPLDRVGGNLESYIKIAADSIKQLRKVDVERVLSQGSHVPKKLVANFIIGNRPDLKQEVEDVLAEQKESEDKAKYAAKVAEIKAKQAERAIVPLSEITVTLKARVEDSNEMAEYDEKADVALKEIDNKMNLARSLIKCLAS